MSFPAELQQRIALLASRHSQSEIARKTGTLVSNVNRYVSGTRIPGEFLGALVSGLDVNPAWLLGGEGAIYRAEAATSSTGTAKELLSLVSAMNAVSKMRLGSLAGKHHLTVLRDLNDALAEYERLRTNLDRQSRSAFEHLIRDFEQAIVRRNLEQAEDLRKAASQVAKLCHDPVLTRDFGSLNVYYEWQFGDPEQAVGLMHRQFLAYLPTGGLDESSTEDALHLVLTLFSARRIVDARRMSRVAIDMLARDSTWSSVTPLRIVGAATEVELGNLARGMTRLNKAWGATDLTGREEVEGLGLRCMLVAGFLKFSQAYGMAQKSRSTARHLLLYALWLEDREALELALKNVGGGDGRVPENALEAVQARCVTLALDGQSAAALRESSQHSDTATTWPFVANSAAFVKNVFAAQLARLAKGPALRAHQVAEDHLLQTKEGITHDLLVRAIHFRNALKLAPRSPVAHADVARARAFFDVHTRRGYRGLAGPQVLQ